MHRQCTGNAQAMHRQCTGNAHAMHMPCTCHAHAMHMLFTCYSHVLHMACSCHSHVLHMICTCSADAEDRLTTCHLQAIKYLYIQTKFWEGTNTPPEKSLLKLSQTPSVCKIWIVCVDFYKHMPVHNFCASHVTLAMVATKTVTYAQTKKSILAFVTSPIFFWTSQNIAFARTLSINCITNAFWIIQ